MTSFIRNFVPSISTQEPSVSRPRLLTPEELRSVAGGAADPLSPGIDGNSGYNPLGSQGYNPLGSQGYNPL